MSRPKASLAEMMGSAAAATGGNLTMSNLPAILGDSMPELPRNAVGRYRLMRALQQRFGDNFRSLPGVSNLMAEFDSHVDLERRMQQLASIRYKTSYTGSDRWAQSQRKQAQGSKGKGGGGQGGGGQSGGFA